MSNKIETHLDSCLPPLLCTMESASCLTPDSHFQCVCERERERKRERLREENESTSKSGHLGQCGGTWASKSSPGTHPPHGDMTTCPAVMSGGSGSHGLASGVSALGMNRRDSKDCTSKTQSVIHDPGESPGNECRKVHFRGNPGWSQRRMIQGGQDWANAKRWTLCCLRVYLPHLLPRAGA